MEILKNIYTLMCWYYIAFIRAHLIYRLPERRCVWIVLHLHLLTVKDPLLTYSCKRLCHVVSGGELYIWQSYYISLFLYIYVGFFCCFILVIVLILIKSLSFKCTKLYLEQCCSFSVTRTTFKIISNKNYAVSFSSCRTVSRWMISFAKDQMK